jgi:hypothetical protein
MNIINTWDVKKWFDGFINIQKIILNVLGE